jgi:hypothetical protein
VVRRFATAPKAPLAVATVLATPLFFAALMAVSLAVEKPTVRHVLKHGKLLTTRGDASTSTEVTIWLLALVPVVAVVLTGVVGMLLGRLGTIAAAVVAIAAAVVLLVPLNSWTRRHTARYPCGADVFCPKKFTQSQDIYRRGEWEAGARHTAMQLGIVTIVISGIAIGLTVLFELRRRRHRPVPVPPPPPEITLGGNL